MADPYNVRRLISNNNLPTGRGNTGFSGAIPGAIPGAIQCQGCQNTQSGNRRKTLDPRHIDARSGRQPKAI
jgi:hypothetical protein